MFLKRRSLDFLCVACSEISHDLLRHSKKLPPSPAFSPRFPSPPPAAPAHQPHQKDPPWLSRPPPARPSGDQPRVSPPLSSAVYLCTVSPPPLPPATYSPAQQHGPMRPQRRPPPPLPPTRLPHYPPAQAAQLPRPPSLTSRTSFPSRRPASSPQRLLFKSSPTNPTDSPIPSDILRPSRSPNRR